MTFRFTNCVPVFAGLQLRIAPERFCYTARNWAGVMYTHDLLHFARH